MRESFFSPDVNAVVHALKEGERQSDTQINTALDTIQHSLEGLLDDERLPERQWREEVAVPLSSLAHVMRKIGNPTPSVEALATEMSI